MTEILRNAGVGVAVLGLVQLLLAWLADRLLGTIDTPLFTDQVREYEPRGIKAFFAPDGKVDDTKVREVFRLTQLASAARAALAALLVAAASLFMILVIVYTANPAPHYKGLRLTVGVLGFLVVAALFIVLLVKVASRHLRSHADAEWKLSPDAKAKRLKRFWARVRCFNVLTPYLTTAFFGSVLAIILIYHVEVSP